MESRHAAPADRARAAMEPTPGGRALKGTPRCNRTLSAPDRRRTCRPGATAPPAKHRGRAVRLASTAAPRLFLVLTLAVALALGLAPVQTVSAVVPATAPATEFSAERAIAHLQRRGTWMRSDVRSGISAITHHLETQCPGLRSVGSEHSSGDSRSPSCSSTRARVSSTELLASARRRTPRTR